MEINAVISQCITTHGQYDLLVALYLSGSHRVNELLVGWDSLIGGLKTIWQIIYDTFFK